jgi:hypothetical protein
MFTLALGPSPARIRPVRAELESSAEADEISSFQNQSLSRIVNVNVVFIGYDEEVVDTEAVDLEIEKYYELYYSDAVLSYAFDLQYLFADHSYSQLLKSFILQNSIEDSWTSRLNETALEIQRDTGTRMSIFLNQSGRAIDASVVEEWFADNPFVPSDEQGYTFYVMNFTDFDSPDHSIEHWYTITDIDLEASSLRDFWRLEWDNPLNPNVRFPYPGFSSTHRLFFLDPSAFQWYLTWARIWWELSVTDPKHQYYCQDLDEFLATHDVTTDEGKWAFAQYLAGWIDDIVANDFSPYFMYLEGPPLVDSLSLQILVLNNASRYDYTNERMSWILNTSIVENSINNLLPYLDFQVSVRFENLSDFPMINSILESCIISREDGWTYIDGLYLFLYLYMVRQMYFDFTVAELVVNSFVFLLKDASMMFAGQEFTGLGGGGQSLILKSVDRYFQTDGMTPKSGLGLVMIHELGHNLGLPHTFQLNRYAGDFIHDVMGYYPYSYSFSKLRTDVMRRTIVDKKLLDLLDELVQDEYLCSQREFSAVIDTLFERMAEKINHVLQQYDEMFYVDAYYTVVEAEKLEKQLRSVILNSVVPATIDIEPETLNLQSEGEWISCYIELPEDYDVADIEDDLIFLNETIPADVNAPIQIGDHDEDGNRDLMVKFDRTSVIEWLETIGYSEEIGSIAEVIFEISGKVKDTLLEGYTTVQIIT